TSGAPAQYLYTAPAVPSVLAFQNPRRTVSALSLPPLRPRRAPILDDPQWRGSWAFTGRPSPDPPKRELQARRPTDPPSGRWRSCYRGCWCSRQVDLARATRGRAPRQVLIADRTSGLDVAGPRSAAVRLAERAGARCGTRARRPCQRA